MVDLDNNAGKDMVKSEKWRKIQTTLLFQMTALSYTCALMMKKTLILLSIKVNNQDVQKHR